MGVEDFDIVLVRTKDRNPSEYATIHHIFIGGRLPAMAQYNPQGWCWLDPIPTTREPQVIKGEGVTHWIDLVEKKK